MINRKILSLMAVVIFSMAVTGCSKEEMDDTKKSMEDAAATVSEKTSDAVDAAGDMAHDAADTAQERGPGRGRACHPAALQHAGDSRAQWRSGAGGAEGLDQGAGLG